MNIFRLLFPSPTIVGPSSIATLPRRGLLSPSRRGFLFAAPAIIAAGSLMPGHSVERFLDPYIMLADKLKSLTRLDDKLRPLYKPGDLAWPFREGNYLDPESYHPVVRVISTRVADILEYMNTNFQNRDRPVSEARAEIVEVWNRQRTLGEYPNLTVAGLRSMQPDVLPVYVAKYILGTRKMPVGIVSMSPHWKTFVHAHSDKLPNI